MTEQSTIDELQWRDLTNQSTSVNALHEVCENPTTLYYGFDSMGNSLRTSHLILMIMLRRFQLAGHHPIALAGGATGFIGGLRGVDERSILSQDAIEYSLEAIKGQLRRLIDFEGEAPMTMINSADQTMNMSAIDFLRDVDKNFSLNTMFNRDTVERRLESGGISYTEFSCMLLQPNDYMQLRRNYDCVLQISGGDQWGNIVSSVDLSRCIDGAKVRGLTVPLVIDTQRWRFGRSTGGGKLRLDAEETSSYSWYQYSLNVGDSVVIDCLRWFTSLTQEEIAEYRVTVTERSFKREAQRRLARETTNLVHGEGTAKIVELAAQALLGRAELTELDETVLVGVVSEIEVAGIAEGEPCTVVDFLAAIGLARSKGEARRTVKEGDAYANNQRIKDEAWKPAAGGPLYGKWIMLRRGKKNSAGVRFAQTLVGLHTGALLVSGSIGVYAT